MPQKGRRRDTKIGILVAVIIAMSAFFVPEVRQFFHLEKPPEETHAVTQTVPQSTPQTQNTEPPKSEPSLPTKKIQRTTTRVKGNDNVAGNNVEDNSNVAGNNSQTAPTAIAPNGIAIAGGIVQNPTVNNYSAPPPRRLSDEQKYQLTSCLKK